MAQVVLQIVAALALMIPVYYDLRTRLTPKYTVEPSTMQNEFGLVKIILPMRDEASNAREIISAILNEVTEINNCTITVVDSASSDGTGTIAQNVLERSSLDNNRWEVITAKVPGKSHCINLVLDSSDSDVFIMIDADVKLESGWFSKITEAVAPVEIGVASGMERRFSTGSGNGRTYKSYSNKVRTKQSCIDTTPILEGGLLCWKSDAMGKFRLNETSNADDAQLVLTAIRNGYRTITLPELLFEDLGGSMGGLRRSIRRSQGLSRVLLRNSDLCFKAPRREAKVALRFAISLYLLLPWSLALMFSNSMIAITLANIHFWSWPMITIIGFGTLFFPRLVGRLFGSKLDNLRSMLFIAGIRFPSWNTNRNRDSQ